MKLDDNRHSGNEMNAYVTTLYYLSEGKKQSHRN
jgi:hypothetical protein